MIRTALYARYSSDRQNDRSIEQQLALLRQVAGARGWIVVATYEDAAISGSAMANRPGLQAMLGAAERGEIAAVLVEDTDRLARDREHDAHIYNRLSAAGVRIATPSSDQVSVIESAVKGLLNELYIANLSSKTSRGMRDNAEQGKATGSKLYGYRSEPGGGMTIVDSEAAVIREIARRYAGGETARQIVADLNERRAPGPRGGQWNASTINGSRQRGNGILHTELYAGVKVWNRMLVKKDRATGKRRPVMRPAEEWRRTPVEHLRIVDRATWDAIQARHAREDGVRPEHLQRRKRGLFSGLLKCRCGATYTVYNHGRLICAAYRERGSSACDNRRTVSRAEIERRVLAGLRDRLLAPDLVEAYVRAYRERMAERTAAAVDRRRPVEKRLAELERSIARAVDAIFDGTASAAVKAKLMQAEAEQAELKAALAAMDAEASAEPVQLHPAAPTMYRMMVDQLQAMLDLASADQLPTADALVEAVRELVIRIEIAPRSSEPRAPVEINVVGDLARFLSPSPGVPAAVCGGALVAGGGYSRAPTSGHAIPFGIAV